MNGFWGYHSGWHLGSPGGWDYQCLTQVIGKAIWARLNQLTPLGVQLDFDHPLLYPTDGLVKMLVAAHQRHLGGSSGLIAVVAETEPLTEVSENRNLAKRLNSLGGVSSALMAPHELEMQIGRVSYKGKPVSIAFVDFNSDVLLALHRRHSLKPLLQLVAEGRVVNPRGTGPINTKSLLELLSSGGKERFSRETVTRTPWTRRFMPGSTIGPDGEPIDDLYEWTRMNWKNLVLKPERGASGMGVRVGGVNLDADEAIAAALLEGHCIVQEKIPLHLWAEEGVSFTPEQGVFIERTQTDFRCLFGADGLFGCVARYGGIPTNVGSGGGMQPLAVLKSDIPVGVVSRQINEAMLKIAADEFREVLEMQLRLSLDYRFTFHRAPIRMALRPRLITMAHLQAMSVYARAVWNDCLMLERMYLEGALEEMIDIPDEELKLTRTQPWGGATAMFAADGLFSFGAHLAEA